MRMLTLNHLILFSMLLVTTSCGGKSSIRVQYNPSNSPDGCSCNGLETFNGNMRPFVVSCTRRGDTFEFRRRRVFRGNPHDCSSYNQNGQETFYQQLIDKIGHRMCNIYVKRRKGEKRDNPTRANGIPCSGPSDRFVYNTDLCPYGTLNTPYKFEYCYE